MTDLKAQFLGLKTRRDVADLLGMELRKLVHYVYRVEDAVKYTEFELRKRSGGTRNIRVPHPAIRFAQRNLSEVLSAVYEPKPSVHGFVNNRSILTNARKHAKKRIVVTVDLKDFFDSIHFGRVRGMFLALPYGIPEDAATFIAHIACIGGTLTQGSPSSPVISNMVCRRLDAQMQRAAHRVGMTYTRYADDLVFSTARRAMPEQVAKQAYGFEGEVNQYVAGDLIREIVEQNGFAINDGKFRVRQIDESQRVTGLVVNRFPNVPRRFVRQIRAMLHAWDKFGHEAAEKEHREKYDKKNRFQNAAPEFKRVLKGKIDYLGLVKGRDSAVYKKLRTWFYHIERKEGGKGPIFPPSQDIPWALLEECVFVVEFYWETVDNDCIVRQGTCFYLEDVGYVTCEHVLPPEDVLWSGRAIRTGKDEEEFGVSIRARDKGLDLGLLDIEAHPRGGLIASGKNTFVHDTTVLVVGFPNYRKGDNVYRSWGKVTQMRVGRDVAHVVVSAVIASGTSGGPVLDDNFKVIGVAVRGVDDTVREGETHYHGVVPIRVVEGFCGAARKHD